MSFTDPMPSSRIKKTSPLVIIQYVVLISVILYFGREIFVPFAFALLISFVLYPVCAWMEKKGIGRMTAIAISVGLMTVVILLISLILVKQIVNFVGEWGDLQPRVTSAILRWQQSAIDYFGITQLQLDQWLSKGIEQAFSSSLKFIGGTISVSAVSLVFAVLIPIYVVLILHYRTLWKEVLFRLLPDESHERVNSMLSLTIEAYYNFIKGMGIVYLVVGLLNSLGLFFLGVPHAFLFGFVASILTFIPYVGIMVGALLPVTIAWATNDSIWYPIGVIGVFTFVQYLEANVIFPFAVSNRLKVNTLAVLLAIFAGGLLWGVSGMILFVPFVGIVKLIADHDPRLASIAMALGTGTTSPPAKTLETMD
jgi:predicted PurR-regulated permease PerM